MANETTTTSGAAKVVDDDAPSAIQVSVGDPPQTTLTSTPPPERGGDGANAGAGAGPDDDDDDDEGGGPSHHRDVVVVPHGKKLMLFTDDGDVAGGGGTTATSAASAQLISDDDASSCSSLSESDQSGGGGDDDPRERGGRGEDAKSGGDGDGYGGGDGGEKSGGRRNDGGDLRVDIPAVTVTVAPPPPGECSPPAAAPGSGQVAVVTPTNEAQNDEIEEGGGDGGDGEGGGVIAAPAGVDLDDQVMFQLQKSLAEARGEAEEWKRRFQGSVGSPGDAGVIDVDGQTLIDLEKSLSESREEAAEWKRQFQMGQEKVLDMAKRCSRLDARLWKADHDRAERAAAAVEREAPPLPDCNNDGGKGEGASSAVRELTSILHQLREQNVDLEEEVSTLRDNKDRQIELLRATNVRLTEQKAEMEAEFMNQLTTLAESRRLVEETYKEKLRGKINSIVFLRKHIIGQDGQIRSLEGALAQVNERHQTVGSFDSDEEDDGVEEDGHGGTGVGDDDDADADADGDAGTGTPSPAGDDAAAATTSERRRRRERVEERTQVRVSVLEQENERLRERLSALTRDNGSLAEEVSGLRDRVVHLSNLEVAVLPELEAELGGARSSLEAMRHDLDLVTRDAEIVEEELRKGLEKSNAERVRLEENFMGQIVAMERAHKASVLDMEGAGAEKDGLIAALERKVETFREKVIRLESDSELESISSQHLFQMGGGGMDAGSATVPKKQHEEIVADLRKAVRERDEKNAALSRQLGTLDEEAAVVSSESRDGDGSSDEDGEEQWC